MKWVIGVFGILLIASTIAAFWNPVHIITAFCCLLMVINGIGHLKENF